MKIKYLCLWSRRINTLFLYHRKKKSNVLLNGWLNGVSYFPVLSPEELRAAQGFRAMAKGRGKPGASLGTPSAHEDAKC